MLAQSWPTVRLECIYWCSNHIAYPPQKKNHIAYQHIFQTGFFSFLVAKEYRWASVNIVYGNTGYNTIRDLSNEFINLSKLFKFELIIWIPATFVQHCSFRFPEILSEWNISYPDGSAIRHEIWVKIGIHLAMPVVHAS
jgi:hypothetical protein